MEARSYNLGNGYQSPRRTTEIYDIKRNSHRVFRKLDTRADLFNPFRHIAWDCDTEEEANQHRRSSKEEDQPAVAGKKYWILNDLKPERPFRVANQIQRTFLVSWINVLLVFMPVGFVLRFVVGPSAATFATNFIAAVPLWFLCDYALEELQKWLGDVAAGLLYVTTRFVTRWLTRIKYLVLCSNTVQLISSVLLIKQGHVDVLQTSLIGGILSNILVLLGLSILSGGVAKPEQFFNRTEAQGSSSLLSIAATSLLIPSASKLLNQATEANIANQSRGASVILISVYLTFLFCQFGTHREVYHAKAHDTSKPARKVPANTIEELMTKTGGTGAIPVLAPLIEVSQRQKLPMLPGQEPTKTKEDSEIHGPQLHFGIAVALFLTTIVLLYFCIDFVVDSINELTATTQLSELFVGLILLPIPNLDFAPISLAVDDRLEQTMKFTVGRSIQTALLVEPLVILIAWGMGVEGVTLAFGGFEIVSLFTTILLLNFLVVDGKVHWYVNRHDRPLFSI